MRVALYIRVSSDEQAKHGVSLNEQRHALLEYANQKKYNVVGIYADEGASASKKPQRRHEFQRMLRDCENGMIDLIVFLKLDRWFRSVKDYYLTQAKLEEYGVRWECVQEDYDTSTRTGRLNLNIRLSIAEDEAANGSDRTKFALDGNVRNGKVNTGTQPYGYIVSEDKRSIKDPATEHEIEEMFRFYFTCLSAYETFYHMESLYPHGFSYTTIARRLKNPKYTGEYRGNPNYRPAYITKEQHEFIVKQFAQNTRKPADRRTYLFNGLLRCPECGRILVSCTLNKKHQGYRCKRHDNRVCDYAHTTREDYIETILLNDLQHYIAGTRISAAIKEKKTKDIDPTVYENRLKRLNDIYIMGNISDEEYQLKSSELKSKIAEIKQIKPAKSTVSPEFKKLLSDGKFDTIYGTFTAQEKRTFWHSIIDHITVNENGRIEDIFYIL